MPKMKSLRRFTLSTTLGHAIGFVPDEMSYVPPEAVQAALAAGCALVDDAESDFYDDLSRANVEFVGDVRTSLIYMGVEQMAAANKPMDFDGSGNPKADVLTAILGFKVLPSEVTPVYQLFLSNKQDGKDYALAPEAVNAKAVLEADTKAELVLLAEDAGIDSGAYKGMNARELRKLLMVKFSGIAAG